MSPQNWIAYNISGYIHTYMTHATCHMTQSDTARSIVLVTISIIIADPSRYSTIMNRSRRWWCLLILVVAVHFDHASAGANTVNSTTTCGSNQTVLQVDLKTDRYPEETSWNVVDITNSSVAVLSKNDYSDGSTLHSDLYCLNRSNCYEFTIIDSYADGICCNVGDGNYTVFYDDGIIAEGGEFGSSETSIRFGDGCPTQSPSVSALPTTTPSVSSLPTSTVSPSVRPSTSPSLSPTASTVPTSSPTEIQDLIAEDNNNRRYFPKRPIRTEGGFSYQPIPNCTSTSDNRVGCVAVPSTYIEDPPHWAGKIYSKHTTCSTNANGRRRCELDVPKSIKATSRALQVHEDY